MSERLYNLEENVERRFSDFVSEHAEQALLWVFTDKATTASGTSLLYVEFETDTFNRHEETLGAFEEDESFYMDTYIELSEAEEEIFNLQSPAVVFIERIIGEDMDIAEEDGTLALITGDYDAEDPYNLFRAVDSLIDTLQCLEVAGTFIPAHKRSYEF